MRERRLIQVAAVSNIVVLSLGVAAWATEMGGSPARSVVLGGESDVNSSQPDLPETRFPGSAVGVTDLPAADPSARLVELPTHELEHLPGGLYEGLLDGDGDLDGGCVWLQTGDGPQSVRWPAGLQAGFLPAGDEAGAFELVNASGRVLARGGETVYFTGARSGGSERLERCHVGEDHVWYVGTVTAESPFE